MLDLHRLRLLRELARLGTINAVAQALSYSPSAVSQQLATLERETGTVLLEPDGRRVRLTPSAQVLVEHAEVLLAQAQRAQADLARAASEPMGRLRVGAFQSAVLTLIPPALLALQARHPDLRIEVSELEPETALPALVSGDLDLVIAEEYPGHELPRAAQIERSTLLADPLRLVTPRAWGSVALADLAERPFVLEPEGTTSRTWSLTECRRAGFEPDVRYASTDLQIHVRLVECGLAAALLPDLCGAHVRPGLRIHDLRGQPEREIFWSVRAGAMHHPNVQVFTQALVAGVNGGATRVGLTCE